MKRTISGMNAYSKMIEAKLPEKTASYTPISHSSVISRVRAEIVSAGFIITGEDYRSTNDGQIAVGTFRMNYKSDPDIDLCANFINSYNKQYAFKFNLGGIEKESGNELMLSNTKFGAYKRVHKGSADILAAGKIKEFIKDSDEYWNELVKRKNVLKSHKLTSNDVFQIVGQLFFERKIWDVSLSTATLWEGPLEQGKWTPIQYDKIIGADGAFSRIRHRMQRQSNFEYSQEFMKIGYKELHIPPNADGSHKIDPHSLHIWPRGEFMLMALSNLDGSFTCTLFMPFVGSNSFESLKDD